PFYLIVLMSGWRGLSEVWPAALVSGVAFAVTQFAVSNYLGPALPDILSAVVSILALVALLSVWKRARVFRFPHEPKAVERPVSPPARLAIAAWIPFALLTLLVSTWGVIHPLLDRGTVL